MPLYFSYVQYSIYSVGSGAWEVGAVKKKICVLEHLSTPHWDSRRRWQLSEGRKEEWVSEWMLKWGRRREGWGGRRWWCEERRKRREEDDNQPCVIKEAVERLTLKTELQSFVSPFQINFKCIRIIDTYCTHGIINSESPAHPSRTLTGLPPMTSWRDGDWQNTAKYKKRNLCQEN